MRVRLDGATLPTALRLAAGLDAVLLDARGRTAVVAVVGWGAPLRSGEVDRLATLAEREAGRVVVLVGDEHSGRDE